MDLLKIPLNQVKSGVNQIFIGKEPWQIVTITTSSVLLFTWLYGFLCDDESEY